MLPHEIWLPSATKDSKAVGRFVDITDEYTDRTGQKRTRELTVLLHKIPGSLEVSSSLCKDNPDGDKLKKQWPLAWAHYLKTKELEKASPPVPAATELGVSGLPIESLDFLGKDKMAYLRSMGFLTAEQLAGMSDADCQNVGFSARQWRKKAAQRLAAPQ
ncbi:MAG: hypothetical protein EHM35_03335 [Planctomycetaceae bacterium]|nr:MAG: hypothetical protein EHM35_03335 [Planctomycetaceae bacterium]